MDFRNLAAYIYHTKISAILRVLMVHLKFYINRVILTHLSLLTFYASKVLFEVFQYFYDLNSLVFQLLLMKEI